MSATISCSRCGKANEPSRLFCAACGSKLDLDGRRWRSPVRWGRWVWRMAEFLLLAAMALLLWPVKPQGAAGTEADARQFKGKKRLLAAAQEQRISTVQAITEQEINAYLAEIVRQDPAPKPSGGLAQLETREVNLRFQPAAITLTVIARWGPLPLSYQLAGRPRAGGGPFDFEVQQARWGHLPLPGPLSKWMIRRIGLILSGMKDDRRVVDGLRRMDAEQGYVRVATVL